MIQSMHACNGHDESGNILQSFTELSSLDTMYFTIAPTEFHEATIISCMKEPSFKIS